MSNYKKNPHFSDEAEKEATDYVSGEMRTYTFRSAVAESPILREMMKLPTFKGKLFDHFWVNSQKRWSYPHVGVSRCKVVMEIYIDYVQRIADILDVVIDLSSAKTPSALDSMAEIMHKTFEENEAPKWENTKMVSRAARAAFDEFGHFEGRPELAQAIRERCVHVGSYCARIATLERQVSGMVMIIPKEAREKFGDRALQASSSAKFKFDKYENQEDQWDPSKLFFTTRRVYGFQQHVGGAISCMIFLTRNALRNAEAWMTAVGRFIAHVTMTIKAGAKQMNVPEERFLGEDPLEIEDAPPAKRSRTD